MTTQSPAPRWLLYGASGYTGRLIAEEAVRRGHRPVLSGRSREKLSPVADALGLEVRLASLDDPRSLAAALEGLPLVMHSAGPFVQTSEPMIRACLAAGAHYLDITGEIPVFENTFGHDAEARARQVTLMSGVGFDVVPTDCLARYVAEQVPGATQLDIAIAAVSQASAGTAKSALLQLPEGGRVRRDGVLHSYPMGHGARRQRFSDRERTVMPIPWGDLATAWRTTHIPNITTYAAFPASSARALRWSYPVLRSALRVGLIRETLMKVVEARVKGPDAARRNAGRSYVWAQARAPDGRQAQAWLETPEGYLFTALAAVRAVEALLAQPRAGALTPAGAFGADFVLGIEGCRRLDSLE
ncbi:saccharopine dehydrogenase NADP-binding domain-containing protein [Myxococcus stipitatus]|uniref:saccharopine dehydrogenase family protein n=1 Tax=Myxococcus stipitatus TaxID=83455 RepID=UPI001F26F72C|nr:saccharopine dehydrogenase NADP-binding domain-containing protein [Myxococcus stipitatus]MCE9668656.1 saccharopine dehydrogenase NADP-binding domain-containing protein [Myxococcus stipitatus]